MLRFDDDLPSAKYHTYNPAIASNWLKMGKIIAYPTESVWGIGCDAFNQAAVERLLILKNRPMAMGLIVLIDDKSRVQDFMTALPANTQQFIADSWDNPKGQAHTWLLPITFWSSKIIAPWVVGQHSSLAVRQINHPAIKKLCQSLVGCSNPYGFLVSTSCNPSNLPPAISFEGAYRYFGDEICYFLGQTLGFDKPSCIYNATNGKLVRI